MHQLLNARFSSLFKLQSYAKRSCMHHTGDCSSAHLPQTQQVTVKNVVTVLCCDDCTLRRSHVASMDLWTSCGFSAPAYMVLHGWSAHVPD
jgi:hypothetical protein